MTLYRWCHLSLFSWIFLPSPPACLSSAGYPGRVIRPALPRSHLPGLHSLCSNGTVSENHIQFRCSWKQGPAGHKLQRIIHPALDWRENTVMFQTWQRHTVHKSELMTGVWAKLNSKDEILIQFVKKDCTWSSLEWISNFTQTCSETLAPGLHRSISTEGQTARKRSLCEGSVQVLKKKNLNLNELYINGLKYLYWMRD